MTPCASRSIYPPLAATIQNWPAKNQGDALDYSLYTEPFCCDEGETVERLTVDVSEETGFVLLWSALSSTFATIGIQGGNIGTQAITLTLETSAGRRYVRTLRIAVMADGGSVDSVPATLAPPEGADIQPAALSLPDGRILTL